MSAPSPGERPETKQKQTPHPSVSFSLFLLCFVPPHIPLVYFQPTHFYYCTILVLLPTTCLVPPPMPPKFPLPAVPHTRHFFLRAPSRIIPSSHHSHHSSSTLPSSSSSLLHNRVKSYSSFTSSSLLRHNTHNRLNLHIRAMSSAPAKKEFLCILPDVPGAQAKRLEVRP